MDFLTIFFIALGLSFDSFAVSLSYGVVESGLSFRRALKLAIAMAFFQGMFPVLGFYMGSIISEQAQTFDHWIAFLLLAFLGFRMIIHGNRNGEDRGEKNLAGNFNILSMAIGTSIDALAVGVSFAFLYDTIWLEALIIGFITLLASMLAIRIGKTAGRRLGPGVEVAGGIILILIGLKILIEHLTQAL
jgi:putative Mn2+ efflux pump MntP